MAQFKVYRWQFNGGNTGYFSQGEVTLPYTGIEVIVLPTPHQLHDGSPHPDMGVLVPDEVEQDTDEEWRPTMGAVAH
jgi:hypothetical protein